MVGCIFEHTQTVYVKRHSDLQQSCIQILWFYHQPVNLLLGTCLRLNSNSRRPMKAHDWDTHLYFLKSSSLSLNPLFRSILMPWRASSASSIWLVFSSTCCCSCWDWLGPAIVWKLETRQGGEVYVKLISDGNEKCTEYYHECITYLIGTAAAKYLPLKQADSASFFV